ncbi:hypothetical protein BDV19DRAFT_383607 [Aspergillus venezuelensis]
MDKQIHYIPHAKEKSIHTLPIRSILAASDRREPDGTTNHWSIYISILTNEVSNEDDGKPPFIHLDCIPTYIKPSTVLQGGSNANIVVSELEFLPSLKHDNGRYKYEFNEEGTGCRYWVTGTLNLLFEKGVLGGQKQVEEVKEAIKMLWPEKTFLELNLGAYYE